MEAELSDEQERFKRGNVPRDLELGAFAIKLIILEDINERTTD